MEYCLICGHPISETNTTGIGCECLSAVKYVIKCNISNDKNLFFALWNAEVQEYKKVFVDAFENTKFRSEFKKSFYQSIKNAERISKKQLDIIKDMLAQKSYDLLNAAIESGNTAKNNLYDQIFNNMLKNISREDIEKARKIIREKRNK